jgi:hypothetical protein
VIPEELRETISSRITAAVGYRIDVANFVFVFALLDVSMDVEFALQQLEGDKPQEYKQAINIVLDSIAKGH